MLIRSATLTLIANVLALGMGLVTSIWLARALGPEGKGEIDLVVASGALAVMATGLSIPSGLTHMVAKASPNLRRLAAQLAALAVGQTLVVAALLAGLQGTAFLGAFLPASNARLGALAVTALTGIGLLTGYTRAVLAGRQQFVRVAWLEVVGRMLLLGGVAAVAGSGLTGRQAVTPAMWATVAAGLFALALTLAFLPPVLRASPPGSGQLGAVLRYSLPAYGANLAQFANYRLDVFLVAYFAGVGQVAWYAIAVSLAQLLWLPSNALQAVIFPRLSQMAEPRQRAGETAQVLRLVLAATLSGGLTLALIGPWLVPALFGEPFRPSVWPLWLLIPGVSVFCIANILCSYLAAAGRPELNLQVSLAGLVVTVAADLWWVPTYGMVGAAAASTLSYLLSSLLALWFFARETGLTVWQVLWPARADFQLAAALLAGGWRRGDRRLPG